MISFSKVSAGIAIALISFLNTTVTGQQLFNVLGGDTRGIMGLNTLNRNSLSISTDPRLLLNVTSIRYYSVSTFDDIYRDKAINFNTDVSKIIQISRLEIPLRSGHNSSAVGLEYSYNSSNIDRISASNERFLFQRQLEQLTIAMGQRLLRGKVEFAGSVGTAKIFGEIKPHYAAALSIKPSRTIALYSKFNKQVNSMNINLDFDEESFPLSSGVVNNIITYGIELAPMELIEAKFSYSKGSSHEENSLSDAEKYRLNPMSESEYINGDLILKSPNNFSLIFKYSSFVNSGNQTLYHYGQKKGKMTKFEFREHDFGLIGSVQVSSNSIFLLEYYKSKLDGYQKGHIELDVILSVLALQGTRYSYRGKLRADMTRIGLGYTKNALGRMSFSSKIGYVWFNPEYDLSSWGSEFLVFGVRDYQRNNLNLKHVEVIVPEIKLGFKFGITTLSYAFAQAIPTVIKKEVESIVRVDDANRPYSVYGGGYHLLEFSISP